MNDTKPISMLDYPLVPTETATTCAVCGVAMPAGALGVEIHPEGLACSAPCIHVLTEGDEYETIEERIEEAQDEIADLEHDIGRLEREMDSLELRKSELRRRPSLPMLEGRR